MVGSPDPKHPIRDQICQHHNKPKGQCDALGSCKNLNCNKIQPKASKRYTVDKFVTFRRGLAYAHNKSENSKLENTLIN